MKMVYERPLMKAQVFAADQYVALCADPNLLNDVNTAQGQIVDLNKERNGWDYVSVIDYKAPSGISGFDLEHIFKQSTKQPMESHADGYEGAQQYMWSITSDVDGSRYYLEYSAEWNDVHQKNGGTGSVFVLYKEETKNQYLDVDWTWFSGTVYKSDNHDTVIAGFVFDTNQVYWS